MTSEDPSAGAESLGGQTDIPPLGLLDLPAPWLDQLLTEVEPQQRLALFRCCRALRDLVLSQHTLAVEFLLPLGPEAVPAAQARLVLACQRSSRVKLIMRGDTSAPAASRTASAISISAGNLMFSAMAAAGHGLSSIQSVEMHDLELDALVPLWLTFTCPNMTTLHLTSCHRFWHPAPGVAICNLPPTNVAIPSCSQLKELHIKYMRIGDSMAVWQHQFKSLTGLNTLHCQGVPHLPQYSSCIGGQITQLTADITWHDILEQQQVPTWFPNVTEMHLPSALIRDELMAGLLGMQHLTQLSCYGFQLYHSYRHCPCRWTSLSFRELVWPALDGLPLGSLRSLRAVPPDPDQDGRFFITPGDDLGAVNRVTAVIAACGGLQCNLGKSLTESRVIVRDRERRPEEYGTVPDHTCLMACLPLVATFQSPALMLGSGQGVTLELLAAIRQHLSGTVRRISFCSGTFAPGVLQALLPNLPTGVSRVGLTDQEPFLEAEITEMCVNAAWPVTVQIERESSQSDWEKGWQQRVQAAMTAAGHQHVTLETREETDDDSEDSHDSSEDGDGGEGEDEDGDE